MAESASNIARTLVGKFWNKSGGWISGLWLCVSIASCSPLPRSSVPSATPNSFPNSLPIVVSTGDGDTLRVDRQGEILTVRIACIDAPEADQPGGEAAAARLRQLLPRGQAVQVRDVETDRYGRTVAELFLGNEPVGVRLVQEGYAVVYDQYLQACPETQDLYIQAETAAREAQRGFWSQSDPVMPWDWRQQQNHSTPASPLSSSSPSATQPACATTDCDCRDFRSQAEAQRFFDSLAGDPHHLDGDRDGRVCEALP